MKPEMQGWHKMAEECLVTIDKMKDDIIAYKKKIDVEFSGWKTRDPEWGNNDARALYFQSLAVTLNNAMFSYIFLRDDMTKEEFWSKRKYELVTIESFLREYALMVKWFTFHSVASCTEETLRAIVRAAPKKFKVKSSDKYWKLIKEILTTTSLIAFEKLFTILGNVRNTLHTNGVFYPTGNPSPNLLYKGRKFQFEVGKPLGWLNEESNFWIIARLNDAMFQIVTAKPISEISDCPRAVNGLAPKY